MTELRLCRATELDPPMREFEMALADQAMTPVLPETEAHPYVLDACVDRTKTKGQRRDPPDPPLLHLRPPLPLEETDAEIKQLEAEIQALLAEAIE